MRWRGTPTQLARIGRVALDAVRVDGDAAPTFRIMLASRTWESDYSSPEALLEDIIHADVPTVKRIEVEASSDARDRRISLVIAPSARGTSDSNPPIAELQVAGADQGWVSDAMQSMREALAPCVKRDVGPLVALSVPLAVAIAGFTGTGFSDKPAKTWFAIMGMAGVGGVILVAAVAVALLPFFEFLPDGAEARRHKLLRLVRRESLWTFRTVIAFMLGLALGWVSHRVLH